MLMQSCMIVESLSQPRIRKSSRNPTSKLSHFQGNVPTFPRAPSSIHFKLFGISGGALDNNEGGSGGSGGNGGINDPVGEDDKDPQSPNSSLVPNNAWVLFFTNMLDAYSKLLIEHPYPTKIISSGIVGGVGDALMQQYTRRNSDTPFDYRRLAVFTSVAAFYIAPVINVWFNWLNGLPMPANFNTVGKALVQMAIDQTIGATVITAGFFFAFEFAQRAFPPYGTFKESFLDAGLKSTKNNLWMTLIANWYCWPVINFVNFLYIPLQYRVLFSNLASVFWNMFLSSVANRKASTD